MRYRMHLLASSLVLSGAIWLSSGTMAPYAATVGRPTVLEPCHYLVNIDQPQHEAAHRLLTGDPSGQWYSSVVLRRILYPVLAYPAVRAFGLMVGGLVTTAILHVVALLVFVAFVRRQAGETAAIAVAWLLATYPGITYWAGLPYAYAAIVPASLLAYVLLDRLQDARVFSEIRIASLLLGFLYLAYDLLPFYGVAAIGLLLVRRRFAWAMASAILQVLPTVLVLLALRRIEIPVMNSNTAAYVTIVRAWLDPGTYGAEWLSYLRGLPLLLVRTFLFSNMIVLPLLAIIAVIVSARRIRIAHPADIALLVTALALFLFNNAAPPYFGWQMRGDWMARLYQPVFPALLMLIARVSAAQTVRWWTVAVGAAVLLHASIVFGPVFLNPVSGWVYAKFYEHSDSGAMIANLRRFGRRPLGICNEDHRLDLAPPLESSGAASRRPEFMYRYSPQELR